MGLDGGPDGGKNPWGERGRRQRGLPVLGRLLSDLAATLRGVLGGPDGGKPGGSGFDVRGVGRKRIRWLVIILLIIWGAAGIYIIEPPEQGVVLRFGHHVRTTEPGPHWVPVFVERVEKVDVEQIYKAEIGFRSVGGSVQMVDSESLMLTQDEGIIDVKFAVLYRIAEPGKYLFNVLGPDDTLHQATEAAVREIVGRSTMKHVMTEGRGDVGVEAQDLMQAILNRYHSGLRVISVNMQSAQPPAQVQAAFTDAVKAGEDEERLKNRARAYAADILPKARGDAVAILEQARAYEASVVALATGETHRFLEVLREYRKAPEVTRERLYLEAMESVLANSSKLLMGVTPGENDGGDSNALEYLPLDRIVAPRGVP